MKKINLLILLVIMVFVSGCGGGGGGDERSINIKYNYNINSNVDKPIGTILAIYDKDNEILVEAGFQNGWNSYCQNDYGDLQVYEKNNDQNLEHYIIGKPASTFKSGYIWKWNDFLYAENKGTPRVYSFELGGAFSELNNARSLINSRTNVDCGVYMYNGYRYTYWESKSLDVGSVVTACDSKNNCSASVMSPKTWIYAFGGQGGGVVSAANDGRIFIHDQKSNSWCEASFVNEEYTCIDGAQVIRGPSRQFYSSIQYGDDVLLGSYPGGHIYQFKDKKLTKWLKDWKKDPAYDYAEAQSMSLYCDSLYVGYWPWGEIYRYDGNEWALTKRLFSEPKINIMSSDYPYLNRPPDNEPGAFYGQRVSNLIPYKNSLIASTSNLTSWVDSIGDGILSKQLANEYGLMHNFTRQGCLTAKVVGLRSQTKDFEIIIKDNEIFVVSEYGVQSMKVKMKRSDIYKIEFPVSGKFGSYSGGEIKLLEVENF